MSDNKYHPIPFWSWNDRLEPEECRRQVRLMADAGMGGFFIHARGGLETEYMGEEWFEAVSACIDEAKKYGIDAWIYDENGWPSGAADGRVCALGIEYQQKKLKCQKSTENTPCTIANINGYHFYYEVNPHYIDVLNKDAAARFIEFTHKPYYDRFGNDIKGFFTDEPQLAMGEYPWSFELAAQYEKIYGEKLSAVVYDLFFDTDTSRRTRTRYWQLTCEMFSESYFKQIYDWCEQRGLMLTGHLLAEESIASQIATSGSVMPHYEYFHMPGVDFLGRNRGRALVSLQVSSAAAQLGKNQVLTESFAMCGHGAGLDELKSIAEVQMVRGVTTLCQHLQGYTMRGLRKRDYPPAMFFQQPWWKYYSKFNSLLAAEGQLLSEGKSDYSTLLIIPMTEAWALYDGTQNSRISALSDIFADMVSRLEAKHILFHLGDETIIKRHAKAEGAALIIGQQRYTRVIICSGCEYAPHVTKLLGSYTRSGGYLTNDIEQLDDENISDNPQILYTKRVCNNKDVYFFVNQSDKEQTSFITIGGNTALHTFAPYESKLLPCVTEVDAPRATLPLDGEWRVKQASDNALLLDFCDYYFDGQLIEKHGYVTNIQRRACELKRPVEIQCRFSAQIEYIPENLCLVCETPEKLHIEINGKAIDKTECGRFIDTAFHKINIARYVVLGQNSIVISTDFALSADTYRNIEAAKRAESVKNKLTFESEIEAVYLTGDFSVGADFKILPPADTITLNHIERQGFSFFSGELVLEKDIELADTSYSLSFLQCGISVSEWKINGYAAGTFMWQPFCADVSKLLKKGMNRIELTIVNNLRNMMGPHHMVGSEGSVGPASFYKEMWLWNFPRNSGWHNEYSFAEMSVIAKGAK